MAKETVLVACRLPNGIIIHHPENPKIEVKLSGIASSQIIGSTFSTTNVDAEFWAAWKAAFAKSPLLGSHAIFEVRNEAEAAAKAKELRNEKTGFERMPQTAFGVSKAVD